jgi:raffinose/stachyose/melibiose transport system substrate-binding protein
MTKKSFARAAALVVASALALTGCSAGGGGDDDVTLEFQTGLGTSDPILAVLTDITEEFQDANPGVTIDLVPMTNTYEADMTVRLSSNDIPDIWATHGWSLLRYSEFLEPLDTQPWAENFNEALEPAMSNDDGQFFAFPAVTDVAGIVYNQTVLDDAGIDPATITTWDAFNDAAAKLKAAGVTPITASGKDSWFAGNVADFLASGAYSEAELSTLADGEFVPGGYTTFLEEVKRWSDADYFNADYSSASQDDIARALADGSTGFVFVQNYLVASALGFNPDAQLGYFPVPGFVTDPYLIGGEGHAYGVSRTSEHKDVALDYLAFLAESDNASTLASAIGGIPGMTNATADLGPLTASYETFVEGGDFRLEPYFDRVYLPGGMWDTMVTTTDAIITGQSDVATAVDQVANQFATLSAK